MKFNTSALFGALFGGRVLDAPPRPSVHGGRTQNKSLPRSRYPGKPQPAGSKLAKAASLGRVGTW